MLKRALSTGCLWLLTGLPSAHAAPDLPGYEQIALQIPADSQTLWLEDIDGDGLADIILERPDSLTLHFQNQRGFDFSKPGDSIAFATAAAAWDLMPARDRSGYDLIALQAAGSGAEVLRWQASNSTLNEPEILLANVTGFLSRGINRLRMVSDINNDAVPDLILPGAGQLALYLGAASGGFQSPFYINADFRMQTSLNPLRLDRGQGQRLRIPALDLRDVNNDGAADLVSKTDLALEVFLASPGQDSYLPTEPSYRLDIAAIEERLGEFDIDNLDFSNLTGVLALTHEELLQDVNGDGIDDLLLREGARVALYLGSSSGMNLEQPQQILRSSGNVLSTFLYDENEDGLDDLWLWRVEPISVTDIFVWLAISGSIAVEAFVYPNEGQQFSRRPTRKVTVNLKFPSFIRLSGDYRELSRSAESTEARRPSAAADLDGEPGPLEAITLVNGQLELFHNQIASGDDESDFLAGLGYSRQRDDYEIDIRQILEQAEVKVDPIVSLVDGLEPQRRIVLAGNPQPAAELADIVPARVNGDGRDDLFVFTGQDASHIRGLLLLSNDSKP